MVGPLVRVTLDNGEYIFFTTDASKNTDKEEMIATNETYY
jgi:hypothetical protein